MDDKLLALMLSLLEKNPEVAKTALPHMVYRQPAPEPRRQAAPPNIGRFGTDLKPWDRMP